MSTIPQQTKQPVPLFYGEITDDTVTQELEAGFDYVLTGVIWTGTAEAGAAIVEIADESSVTFMRLYADASGDSYAPTDQRFGEMPIGPRTSLILTHYGQTGVLLVAGYALNPTTALHV